MLTFSRLTAGSKFRLGYVRVSTYVTLFHSFYISFSLSSEFPDASRSRNCIRDGADVRICISADRVYRKYTMQRVRGDIVAFNGRKKREKKRHQCERTHGEEVTDGIVTRISNVRRWIKSGRAYLVHAIPHRLLEFRLTSDKAERSTSALRENPYLFGILLNGGALSFSFSGDFQEPELMEKCATCQGLQWRDIFED